jgi:DNA-binding NtrC family response regulator
MRTHAGRTLNLVLLDDDPDLVRLVSKFLNQAFDQRLRVVGFTDPTAALDWIDRECCDILLSDVQMPGTDGLSVLRRAKVRNPWTQVILMTAHSSWESISEALENGASDYVLKPIHRDNLLTIVAETYGRIVRWQAAVGNTFALSRAQG